MPMADADLTAILRRYAGGDASALAELTPLVYDDLRQRARLFLRRERADHSLSSIDLVHEAYLRLVAAKDADWKDRAHFFAVSAGVMRHILVDHARARVAEKRGGGEITLALNEQLDAAVDTHNFEVIALDAALLRLAKLDAQQSRIVELRFFAGLTVPETAEVLGTSVASVNRSWASARAWLIRDMKRQPR